MKYWCYNCERQFDVPVEKEEHQSRLFGVEVLSNDKMIIIKLCPFCRSEEIEEVNEDDESI